MNQYTHIVGEDSMIVGYQSAPCVYPIKQQIIFITYATKNLVCNKIVLLKDSFMFYLSVAVAVNAM
jgi:hypothetical protein